MALLDGRTAQNVIALRFRTPTCACWRPAGGAGRSTTRKSRSCAARSSRPWTPAPCGLSTGLDYIAQCFATTDELVEVCRRMAPWQAPYVTHVRYKKGTLAGVQEAVEIGRRAGVPVHISHLKAGTPRKPTRILDYVDRVAVHEVDFSFDIYPYLPGSTMLNYLLPYEVWEDGPLAACAKLRDPAIRQRLGLLLACFDVPLERIRLAWVSTARPTQQYQGWSLADYAAHAGKPPAERCAICLIDGEPGGAVGLGQWATTGWSSRFSRIRSSCSAATAFIFADGQVHPRVYGSAPRILGPLVRDRKLFSLEEAVRKHDQHAGRALRTGRSRRDSRGGVCRPGRVRSATRSPIAPRTTTRTSFRWASSTCSWAAWRSSLTARPLRTWGPCCPAGHSRFRAGS